MTVYSAPLDEIRFALDEIAGLPALAGLPGFEEATPDLVEAVLDGAGKVAAEVLAPLNHPGDKHGCTFENGVVRTPPGSVEAFRTFAEGGWAALPFDPDYGGQGLPWTLALAVQEMWQSANMALGNCPLLTQGAIELLQAHGTEAQKALYLPKMIAGEWSGTMNLTEPQAGTDVGALKTRAEPAEDGRYRIVGQKIFITYGEQDLTENIVHLVLARTPDAPAGSKGISLFIVPKFLVNPDGSLGPRNDLRCVSIEHKLGINASPTAVMAYGDDGGATGELVGEERQGMACMFTMMNNARIAVGIQGLAIAERAYQQALVFARERVQSAEIGGTGPGGVAIIRHPDVRRMLLTMKARTTAARAICYLGGAALDRAHRETDPDIKAAAQARADLLTPVIKSWSTDIGCEVASAGVQVHGGMGFVEETGAAQHYRDARILPIYEGTNGVQGLDLVMRKLLRDGGAAARGFTAELRQELEGDEHAGTLGPALDLVDKVGNWIIEAGAKDPRRAAAGATPYLNLFGTVTGGALLARGARAATAKLANGGNGYDRDFLEAQRTLARFYLADQLPQAESLARSVTQGADALLTAEDAHF